MREPTEGFDASGESVAACRQELAARLGAALAVRGWSQSDLVRASGLGRPQVSVYVRGRQLPGEGAMAALAAALDLDPEDLLPGFGRRRETGGVAAGLFRLTAVDGHPERVMIEIRREVDTATALRIAEMIGVEVPR